MISIKRLGHSLASLKPVRAFSTSAVMHSSSVQSTLESYNTDTASIAKLLSAETASRPVFVATKSFCPFCNRAKRLLDSYGTEYVDVELDLMKNGDAVQKVLFDMTTQSTVPNVFIGGKHIGGMFLFFIC